nr:hypothetical protein HAGR004_20220 [Bdellovibrio sp. HAGR004]
MAELINDFPVVVRGKIISRTPISKDENIFVLKLRIERYVKGDLKKTELNATEVHFGKGLPRYYEVGKVYTFPVVLKDNKDSYEVILPVDGCPDLPIE